MSRTRLSLPVSLALAATLLGVAVVLGCATGSVSLSPEQVIKALLAGPPGAEIGAADDLSAIIIWDLRLPRIVLGALVGAALSVSGAALQGLFRNPLADPYVLGVSAGGALGAATALVLFAQAAGFGLGAVPVFAFAGAVGAALLVYRLALVGGRLPLTGVLLAGVAVGLTLSAGVSLVLFLAESQAGDVVLWLMGHLAGASWAEVWWVAGCTVIGLGVVAIFTSDLDLLLEGEEVAASLGVAVERVKLSVLLATALLVAGAVSFCGVIGFVGLVVPHAVRFVSGPRHRWLLPLSAIVGAAVLVLADTAARAILPEGELPVGVVTGAIGGPFFLLLLRRSLTPGA